MNRKLHRIIVLFIAGAALIAACSDDGSSPRNNQGDGPFRSILQMDENCEIVGGDTLDFQPRPEGFIDTMAVPPVVGPPTNYSLIGACPNPGIQCTQIHWQIPQPDSVWILVFDAMRAPAMDTLYSRSGPAGSYTIIWCPEQTGYYRIRMYTATGFVSYGDVLIEP